MADYTSFSAEMPFKTRSAKRNHFPQSVYNQRKDSYKTMRFSTIRIIKFNIRNMDLNTHQVLQYTNYVYLRKKHGIYTTTSIQRILKSFCQSLRSCLCVSWQQATRKIPELVFVKFRYLSLDTPTVTFHKNLHAQPGQYLSERKKASMNVHTQEVRRHISLLIHSFRISYGFQDNTAHVKLHT